MQWLSILYFQGVFKLSHRIKWCAVLISCKQVFLYDSHTYWHRSHIWIVTGKLTCVHKMMCLLLRKQRGRLKNLWNTQSQSTNLFPGWFQVIQSTSQIHSLYRFKTYCAFKDWVHHCNSVTVTCMYLCMHLLIMTEQTKREKPHLLSACSTQKLAWNCWSTLWLVQLSFSVIKKEIFLSHLFQI